MVQGDQKEVLRTLNCCWVPESLMKETAIPCFVIHATAAQKDDKVLLHFGIHNVFLLRCEQDQNGILSEVEADFDSFYSPRKLVERKRKRTVVHQADHHVHQESSGVPRWVCQG